jgi:hypothetical protein
MINDAVVFERVKLPLVDIDRKGSQIKGSC